LRSPLNPPILYYTIGAGKSQVFLAKKKKLKKIKQKLLTFIPNFDIIYIEKMRKERKQKKLKAKNKKNS